MTQQWTRDDLPSLPDVLGDVTTHECGEGAAAYRTAALAHLNAHHPKPDSSGVDWKSMYEHEIRNRVEAVDRAARAERERDESLRKKGEMVDRAVRAERERDAAVARAEQAENARDTAATRAAQLEREVSKVEGRASEWSIKAQQWRERAEAAETRTAVTREDVEKVVHGSGGGFFDSRLDAITDAVCALFGIEAEQATDPVEEKSRELYRAAMPDARWETVADEYRRIARHVLGQEATR